LKVLIIHASFGAGHKRAAQALLEAFRIKQVDAEVRDLLEFMPRSMANFYSSAYDFMITSGRLLWRLTYNLVNAPKGPYRPARAATQRWQFTRLKNFLKTSDFTHVIATHFTPAALLTDWRMMEFINCKIFSVITDHEAHRWWKRTGLDHYFVASRTVSSQMQTLGIPERDITVSGIPISPSFSSALTREQARAAWNLPQQSKVILVLCSALTFKKCIEMLCEFADTNIPSHFLVSAGFDTAKEKKLRDYFAADSRFMIFGITDRIADMMKASDLIVTKPGGLIVSESLAAGLPPILLEPIPGQEEANAKYAVEHGAACCLDHKPGVYKEALYDIISNPERLEQMSAAAASAGKPNAALEIVETVVSKFVV
jgi:processive 1,2-diacylglycerol beta-glucosyltransferase